jgi:hypothetical protein
MGVGATRESPVGLIGLDRRAVHEPPLRERGKPTDSGPSTANLRIYQQDLDIPRYIRLCQAGKMRLDGLITHEFGLDQINEAIEVVRSGEAGRCVISMS